MYRYDYESSRPGLGRKKHQNVISSHFQFLQNVLLGFAGCFLFIFTFAPGGADYSKKLMFFTQQQRQEPYQKCKNLNCLHL